MFLVVFASVNIAAAWHGTWARALIWLPALAALGCLGAAGLLVARLGSQQPVILAVLGGVAALLAALRAVFLWRR